MSPDDLRAHQARITRSYRAQTMRLIASLSRDTADCRRLLDVLGLTADDRISARTAHAA